MQYFVLVYNQHSGKVLVEKFSEQAGQAALARRFELETENRQRPEIEVVLLGANSEADLARTHARYFKSVRELSAAG